MMDQVKKYFDNQLDLIETPYLLQDNKRRLYEYEKSSLQLDEFMV